MKFKENKINAIPLDLQRFFNFRKKKETKTHELTIYNGDIWQFRDHCEIETKS